VIACSGFSGFSADERYAFWVKADPGNPIPSFDLWGFDTVTLSAFPIASDLPQNPNRAWPASAAGDGMLAWLHHPPDRPAVLRFGPRAAALPNAPEPPGASATLSVPVITCRASFVRSGNGTANCRPSATR
jgi:hypothetical protein